MEKGREIAGDLPSILGALAQIYGCAGNTPRSRRLLAQLHDLARLRHVAANSFAVAHLGLREPEEALQWLEKGFADHEPAMAMIKVLPVYDDLRSLPQFQSLIERMGFPA
jgi:hypothetical protein